MKIAFNLAALESRTRRLRPRMHLFCLTATAVFLAGLFLFGQTAVVRRVSTTLHLRGEHSHGDLHDDDTHDGEHAHDGEHGEHLHDGEQRAENLSLAAAEIRSASNLMQAIEELGLDGRSDSPAPSAGDQEQMASDLLARLQVRAFHGEGDGMQVHIAFSDRDRALASALVNHLARRYVASYQASFKQRLAEERDRMGIAASACLNCFLTVPNSELNKSTDVRTLAASLPAALS